MSTLGIIILDGLRCYYRGTPDGITGSNVNKKEKMTSFEYTAEGIGLNVNCFFGIEFDIKVEEPMTFTLTLVDYDGLCASMNMSMSGGGYNRMILPLDLLDDEGRGIDLFSVKKIMFSADKPFGLDNVHFKQGRSIALECGEIDEEAKAVIRVINCESYAQDVNLYNLLPPDGDAIAQFDRSMIRVEPYSAEEVVAVLPSVGEYGICAIPSGNAAFAEVFDLELED